MKALFLVILLLAMMFVMYEQRQKIGELSQSLAVQTERADKLQADLDATKKVQVKEEAKSWMYDPNRKNPLDAGHGGR